MRRAGRGAAVTRTPLARAVSRTSYLTLTGKGNVVAALDGVHYVIGSDSFIVKVVAGEEEWTTYRPIKRPYRCVSR
jgi:hypothetical protein